MGIENQSQKMSVKELYKRVHSEIRKNAKPDRSMHSEFGEVSYHQILKKHHMLMEQYLGGEDTLETSKVLDLVDVIKKAEVSDLSNRSFMRSTLLFWSSKLRDRGINDVNIDIQPPKKWE